MWYCATVSLFNHLVFTWMWYVFFSPGCDTVELAGRAPPQLRQSAPGRLMSVFMRSENGFWHHLVLDLWILDLGSWTLGQGLWLQGATLAGLIHPSSQQQCANRMSLRENVKSVYATIQQKAFTNWQIWSTRKTDFPKAFKTRAWFSTSLKSAFPKAFKTCILLSTSMNYKLQNWLKQQSVWKFFKLGSVDVACTSGPNKFEA